MHVRVGTRFKPRLCYSMYFQSLSLSLSLSLYVSLCMSLSLSVSLCLSLSPVSEKKAFPAWCSMLPDSVQIWSGYPSSLIHFFAALFRFLSGSLSAFTQFILSTTADLSCDLYYLFPVYVSVFVSNQNYIVLLYYSVFFVSEIYILN